MEQAQAQANKIKSLEAQVKASWRKYYLLLEMFQPILESNSQLVKKLGDINLEEPLPKHIVNELVDNAKKLNIEFSCPICFDVLKKDTIYMTRCGHKLCLSCYDTLKDNKPLAHNYVSCPTCRARVYLKTLLEKV